MVAEGDVIETHSAGLEESKHLYCELMMEGSGEHGDRGPTAMRKQVLLTSRELRRGSKAQLRSTASASARI